MKFNIDNLTPELKKMNEDYETLDEEEKIITRAFVTIIATMTSPNIEDGVRRDTLNHTLQLFHADITLLLFNRIGELFRDPETLDHVPMIVANNAIEILKVRGVIAEQFGRLMELYRETLVKEIQEKMR